MRVALGMRLQRCSRLLLRPAGRPLALPRRFLDPRGKPCFSNFLFSVLIRAAMAWAAGVNNYIWCSDGGWLAVASCPWLPLPRRSCGLRQRRESSEPPQPLSQPP